MHTRPNHATRHKNHQQSFASCLSLSIMMYQYLQHNCQFESKRNKLYQVTNKPAIVCGLSGYTETGSLGDMLISGYTHHAVNA